MQRYLLWDFDGTLAFRDGMWSKTLYDLLLKYGFDTISIDDIRPYMIEIFPWNSHDLTHAELFQGLSWWDYISREIEIIIRNLGVNESLVVEISKRFKDEYLDLTKWYLFDDTLPCLQKTLSQGYINIIISNHVPELSDLVKALGIDIYFKEIHSSANIGYEKPNIMIFKRVIDKLEDSTDITMIGDNYSADVEGALNAGLKAILVRRENIYNYPKYCKNLDEIFDFL